MHRQSIRPFPGHPGQFGFHPLPRQFQRFPAQKNGPKPRVASGRSLHHLECVSAPALPFPTLDPAAPDHSAALGMNESVGRTPSPSQREAIESPAEPLLVLAGPGAGKTFCLIERIRFLLERLAIDPTRICAFTFTN